MHCNAIINGKCLHFVGVAGTARDDVSGPLNRTSLMEEGSARLCFPFLSSAPVTDSVSVVRVSVSGLSLKRPFRHPAVGTRCTAERAVSVNAVSACCPGGIPRAHAGSVSRQPAHGSAYSAVAARDALTLPLGHPLCGYVCVCVNQ